MDVIKSYHNQLRSFLRGEIKEFNFTGMEYTLNLLNRDFYLYQYKVKRNNTNKMFYIYVDTYQYYPLNGVINTICKNYILGEHSNKRSLIQNLRQIENCNYNVLIDKTQGVKTPNLSNIINIKFDWCHHMHYIRIALWFVAIVYNYDSNYYDFDIIKHCLKQRLNESKDKIKFYKDENLLTTDDFYNLVESNRIHELKGHLTIKILK